MRKYILAVSLLLVSCAAQEQQTMKQPTQSAGSALTAYYDAVAVNDTNNALQLSTVIRQKWLRENAAAYWKAAPTKVTARVLEDREDMTVKIRHIVRFEQTQMDRKSGAVHRVDTLDCEMILEDGDWRVSTCYPPVR